MASLNSNTVSLLGDDQSHTSSTPSRARWFVSGFALLLLLGVIAATVVIVLPAGSSEAAEGTHPHDLSDYLDPHPEDHLLDEAGIRVDFNNATKVLKPSCDSLWEKKHKHSNKKMKVFKHPSDLPENKDVYCIPLEFVRFSQDSISNATSSGKSLQYWIDKFHEAGYYKKRDIPDMVHWRDDYYESIDNRRIYCALKAGLTWVPAHVHELDEPLPQDQLHRFQLNITSWYFKGRKFASTWGEGAVYRGISERTVNFFAFGSKALPQIDPVVPKNTTNSSTPVTRSERAPKRVRHTNVRPARK